LELDKTKNYYIYCRSGNRSYHAGVFMLAEGFESVQHLKDGIISWTEKLER
jgi:rhodanese-related sulfurtransferase